VISKGFANKLKDIAYALYAWAGHKSPEHYESHELDKDEILDLVGKSVRQIWIEIGMKFREIYSGTWIDYLLQTNSADLLIVPDVRFPNEIDAIHNRGGKCIKIIRPNIPDTHDVADDALNHYDNHWDAIITNDSSLNGFNNNIIQTFERLYECQNISQ
jgi:hypothetical protein